MSKPEKKSHVIIGLLFIFLWSTPLKIFGQEAIPLYYQRVANDHVGAIPLYYLSDVNNHVGDTVNFIGWVKKVKQIKSSKEISFQIYDKNRDDQPISVIIKEDLFKTMPALNVKNLTGNLLRVTGLVVKENNINVVHILIQAKLQILPIGIRCRLATPITHPLETRNL